MWQHVKQINTSDSQHTKTRHWRIPSQFSALKYIGARVHDIQFCSVYIFCNTLSVQFLSEWKKNHLNRGFLGVWRARCIISHFVSGCQWSGVTGHAGSYQDIGFQHTTKMNRWIHTCTAAHHLQICKACLIIGYKSPVSTNEQKCHTRKEFSRLLAQFRKWGIIFSQGWIVHWTLFKGCFAHTGCSRASRDDHESQVMRGLDRYWISMSQRLPRSAHVTRK